MIILKAALSVGAYEYLACRLAASYNDSMLAKLVEENNLGLISDQGYVDCFVPRGEQKTSSRSYRRTFRSK